MRVVRAFGLEAARRDGFVRRMETVREAQLAFQHAAGTARALTQTGAALAVALTLVAATRGFGLALADTLVLIMALVRLLSTLMSIQDAWRTVLHALPAHAHAHAFLEHWRAAGEPAREGPGSLPLLTDCIRLEGVGYRHDRARPPALSGISAVIPARRVTALVGPSGAGKSTLADMLLGLIAPTEGQIRVDGRVLEGPLRRDWRQRIGYVPQDGFLFHDTIRANLTAVAPAAGDDALWRALDQVGAADFVRRLPQGMETVVGDRGTRLSGGERQRLALVRALLAEPAMVILDEATSALDSDSERQILDALDRLRGRLTMVVIAHRPSAVQSADHVIMLDQGRLVATGSWSEVAASANRLPDPMARPLDAQ
ncbi:MAG: ATP-binding cassette domain-containing protein [Rhodospirillaceae bacterium]